MSSKTNANVSAEGTYKPPSDKGRIFPSTPDDEVVISGVAGRYPSCDHVGDLRENLFNKIDMVRENDVRFDNSSCQELPSRSGVINNLSKFDASFFGIHSQQSDAMDPQGRILLECAYEAIMDAGIHPQSLRNTRTGVFLAACFSEAEKSFLFNNTAKNGLAVLGCSRSLLANRISYCLGLVGPSVSIDTACSSGMIALDSAFTALRTGQCESALVCGSNLLLHPYTTINFYRTGILAKDGFCRTFDEKASGYVRSESICAIFLQKARNAKRIYAKVVYSNVNCDGYKDEGMLYPSGKMQVELLRDFYADLKLDPRIVSYVEAHGTGTKAGDPEECSTLDRIFCTNREEPLLIGSVKSNIGHTEASSGICSVTKMLLAFEEGAIPPNLHFKTPRKDVPALVEGRLKVCTKVTPLPGNLAAVNSFGFGGANAHVLLARFEKEKTNFGIPIDSIPRLIFWAGRTKEAVDKIFDNLESKPLDAEFIGLLHGIQKYEQTGLLYRGYVILEKGDTESENKAKCRGRVVDHCDVVKKPVVWMFTGMGSQWTGMATSLMHLDLFRETIHKCHAILKPYGLDLISIVTSTDETTFDNILHSFVGIAAIQIAIVDVLRLLEVPFDHCIGHSVGELGCAYADGTLTAEQMIKAAYARGLVSIQTIIIHGSMAAVGLSYNDIKDIVPPSIEIACHNSCNSSTISGPKEDVSKFVAELKSKGVFAKEVAVSNIPYHSRYIAGMGPEFLKMLKDLIPQPCRRTGKWISSSVPKENWDSELSQFSSAEYHANNLLSPVLFEEAAKSLPENAITIEIAPHGLLQAIIKKCLPNGVHIPLTNRVSDDNLTFFFGALGKLFLNGIHLPLERLYPAIKYPVSRGTQMISPLILWEHSLDWFSAEYDEQCAQTSCQRLFFVNISHDESRYMRGHIIDGRILCPATAYLHLVRVTVVDMSLGQSFDATDIEFENVQFLRATNLSGATDIQLTVVVHIGSGAFEVTEKSTTVITGTVRVLKNGEPITDLSPWIKSEGTHTLDQTDFYKELRLRGYHYVDLFKSVVEVQSDGSMGKIKWQDNWPAFMDCMLQVNALSLDSRSLCIPISIRKIRINTERHLQAIAELDPENRVLEVNSSRKVNMVTCGGIEMEGLVCRSISRRNPPGVEVLDSYEFVPFNCDSIEYQKNEAVSIFVQIALENLMQHKLKIVEIDESEPQKEELENGSQGQPESETNKPEEEEEVKKEELNTLIQVFDDVIGNIPIVTVDLLLLCKKKMEIDHVAIEDSELQQQTDCHFLIASNWLNDSERIALAQGSLADKGFLVLREGRDTFWKDIKCPEGFCLISVIKVPGETLILLQRAQPIVSKSVINIDSNDGEFEWLEPLKESIKNGATVVAVERNSASGLLGLINCIRREPNCSNSVRGVLIDDEIAPQFDTDHPEYAEQLRLDLAVNVYKNGQWGTYRHMELRKNIEDGCHEGHYFANVKRIGDLSSFEWTTGRLNTSRREHLANIHYSAINFRDVMFATGRLPIEMHSTNRLQQQCFFGFEYSGISADGERVMGIVPAGAMATHTEYSPNLIWRVPDTMSLRDAATIPVVYLTIYYAFFSDRPISKGKSILIHAGSGGIGLAAIRVALAHGMEVYTTCSTQQKKQFILDQFPQLKEENIGNSRDCSFERMIQRQTDCKGVDYVLNSLAEDKLKASLRCLGRGGVFMEIGKFDIMTNSKLDMASFANEVTFRCIMTENIQDMDQGEHMETIRKIIQRDLDNGLIQPLPSTVFQVHEIENAFRYLSTGKHVGKVLIQIRENETSIASLPMQIRTIINFDPEMVYIIPGGLGGFGLELADWMMVRGCRKLVLSSRTGMKNGYQAYRIKIWESHGCKVVINTADITTYQGCKSLLTEALTHGAIGGIFNLAVVLHDNILENQSVNNFLESFGPKVFATRFLDELSRELCPNLEHFVVFSSVVCGFGNAGQSNYGMANSIMERIIDKRVRDGLPGKAIQWGAVGDVGLVAKMTEDKIDLCIAGTVQQRISACLNALDNLLSSKEPVVSSMVVAQKHALDKTSLLQSVLHILGIKDLKSVSKHATLAEHGMDSLMAVEIKQVLDRDFGLDITAAELRALTFEKLQELTDSISKGEKPTRFQKPELTQKMLFRSLGDEKAAHESIISLNIADSNQPSDTLALLISSIEGVICPGLSALCKSIEVPIYALQYHAHCRVETFSELVSSIAKSVMGLFDGKQRFVLIGHSFGAVLAIKLAKLLEQNGLAGDVVCVDGAVALFKQSMQTHMPQLETLDESVQRFILMQLIYETLPNLELDEIKKVFSENKTFEDRADAFIDMISKSEYSKEYLKNFGYGLSNRLKMILSESDKCEVDDRIQSNIKLIRPKVHLVPEIENDYNLKQYTNGQVTVNFVEGNHLSMMDNSELYSIVNDVCMQ